MGFLNHQQYLDCLSKLAETRPSKWSLSWISWLHELVSKNGTHLKVWFLFFHIWRKQLHIQILLPISNSATQTHQQSTNSQQKILQSQTPLVLSWIHHLLRPFTASALVPFRPQLPCLPASPRAGNDPKTWASWGSWPGSTTGSACQVRTGKLKIKHFHGKKMLNLPIMSRAACQVFWMISRVYYVYDYVYTNFNKNLCHAWYQGDVLISSVHGGTCHPFTFKPRKVRPSRAQFPWTLPSLGSKAVPPDHRKTWMQWWYLY